MKRQWAVTQYMASWQELPERSSHRRPDLVIPVAQGRQRVTAMRDRAWQCGKGRSKAGEQGHSEHSAGPRQADWNLTHSKQNPPGRWRGVTRLTRREASGRYVRGSAWRGLLGSGACRQV